MSNFVEMGQYMCTDNAFNDSQNGDFPLAYVGLYRFRKLEILTAYRSEGQFSTKRLLRYGELTVLKMAAVRPLEYLKIVFRSACPFCITMPNFMAIGQTTAQIWQLIKF